MEQQASSQVGTTLIRGALNLEKNLNLKVNILSVSQTRFLWVAMAVMKLAL